MSDDQREDALRFEEMLEELSEARLDVAQANGRFEQANQELRTQAARWTTTWTAPPTAPTVELNPHFDVPPQPDWGVRRDRWYTQRRQTCPKCGSSRDQREMTFNGPIFVKKKGEEWLEFCCTCCGWCSRIRPLDQADVEISDDQS